MTPATPRQTRKRRKPGFVEKTLGEITHNIEQTVFTEENARRPAFLQSFDPRLKLVLFGALLVTIGLAHNVATIVFIYAFTLALALLSHIPFEFFFKRVWLGIPFFAGIVVLPSLFLIPGVPLLALPIPGTSFVVTISVQAVMGAIIFVARVGASVSLAVLLVITTPWADLLKALAVLHVPEVFVLILGMTYRYIFLFLRTLDNMLLSRKSRTVGETSGGEQRQWIVASIGVMLGKSFKMSNDVYQAMLSRGFNGRVRTLDDYRMKPRDWALGALTLAVIAAAMLWDRRILG
ncbi:MAG: cobalt ECF transporter T component CbiQ [Chloroflexi bacterium]|nr:cobalt ECF transporter T component CbiQ [Chloroflexota bacterium]